MIKESVNTLLSAVLANSWSMELPPNPSWPALQYEIATEEEPQWCMNGGYDQHDITVLILAKTAEEITALIPTIKSAMQLLPGFMYVGGEGDADYEGDPNVYAYFLLFRVRSPKW